jgi:hypothetical protein
MSLFVLASQIPGLKAWMAPKCHNTDFLSKPDKKGGPQGRLACFKRRDFLKMIRQA